MTHIWGFFFGVSHGSVITVGLRHCVVDVSPALIVWD